MNGNKKLTEKKLQEKNEKLHEAIIEAQQQKEVLEWASMRSEEQNKQLQETVKKLEAANRQLAETQARLVQSEKMAIVGQLAAGVAHEINNPIGYVNGNLSILDSYLNDIKTLEEKFRNVTRAVYEGRNDELIWLIEDIERFKTEKDLNFAFDDIPKLMAESREGLGMVTSIVKDLKEFSHVEESDMKEFNVNRELDNTISVIWNQVQLKAGIEKDYGDIPTIKGYPQQLNHAFMNMLLNAANAVEKSTSDGNIRISTRHENEAVIIEISDNGCGIAEEHIPKIFEPFFTTKPVGKGKGLGLCTVYNAVKKHNGEIDIRSKVGEGTTFIIKLPVDKGGDDTLLLR